MWASQKQEAFAILGLELDPDDPLTSWDYFQRAYKLIKDYKGLKYKLQFTLFQWLRFSRLRKIDKFRQKYRIFTEKILDFQSYKSIWDDVWQIEYIANLLTSARRKTSHGDSFEW